MKEEMTVLRRDTRGEELKANLSSQQLVSSYLTYWNIAPTIPLPMATLAATVKPSPGKKPEIQHPTMASKNPPKQPQDQRQEHNQEPDEEEIDLETYPPPQILKKIPDNSPVKEILLPLLQDSLDNVQDQVNAETNQRINEATTRRLQAEAEAEAEAQQGKGKGISTIPIIRVNSEDTSTTSSQHEGSSKPGQRKSRFGIRRMVNKIIDRPESRDGSGSEASESRENLSGELLPQNTEDTPVRPFHRFIKKHKRPSSESAQPTDTETIECTACFSDIPPKLAVKTPCHSYCTDCFSQLISTALSAQAQWPPKCCLNPIPYRTIAKHTTPQLLKRYKDKEAEYKVPVANRIYCTHPDCGEWIRKFDKANKTARCSLGHAMCVLCRQPPHRGHETCPQDRDLQLLDEVAEESGWRRCFKCRMLVEHSEACSHMTCRCGAQFCYICGSKWRTCHCDGRELQRIKERAERRRQEREAQTPEEAWLQNALQLIENYEREERQRREEAAARRERRERARLAELEVRYNQLQSDLMGLEDWQRMELLRGHTREVDEGRLAAIDERRQTWDTLFQERTELRFTAQEKITNYELMREREYKVRVGWEKQLEEDYARELEEFWSNKHNGQEFLDQTLRSYLAKNDLRRDVWRKQTDTEMKAFRHATEEELAVREECIEASIERAAEVAEYKQREVKRKHKAELRWLELAVAERNRLLEEMEAVERENGGEMEGVSSGGVTEDEMELSS